MTGDRLNDAQRRAVATRGADLCVEAGAGTGKTRVLTERIAALVDDGADLSRILAITFTEKAAHEMKQRLAATLLARGKASAREDVEAASISTVHGFCARLLREHAVEAGLDPAFAIVDELRAAELRREALAALVAELAAEAESGGGDGGEAGGDGRAGAMAELATLRGGDPEETLLEVYERARESVHTVGEFVRRLPPGPSPTAAIDDVRQAAGAVTALRDAAKGAWRRKIDAVAAAVVELPDSVGGAAAAADAAAALSAVASAFDLRGGAGPVKDACGVLKDACAAALAILADACQAPLRERLATALARLEELHDAAKGHGVALDFADLERRAVRLLDERPDVAAALRSRFTEVLVDEFQDTSPIQAALFERIRPPHALFVVGDPKQSIYGFRGADVDVFLERRERVATCGELVRLDESFRARAGVTGFVNRVFAGGVSAPDPDAGVRGVPYEPLVAARAFPVLDDPQVEILAFDAPDAQTARETEAAWIAGRVHAMVAGPSPVAVTRRAGDDGDADVLGPAEYGDIAILLRATPHVKLLERALMAHEIPYLVVKGRGFFEAREVVDLGNLLGCVADPTDDIRLAAVLRSPVCGVSDDTLYVLASRRGKGTLVEALMRVVEDAGEDTGEDLDAADVGRLRAFAATFGALRAARGREPLAELVDRAIALTRLDLLVLARPNGRQRAANLRKVRDLALAADRTGDAPLAAFAAGLREMRRREVRETEAPVAGAARGAVAILTVHAAKGLEFPIVFVPDLGRTDRHAGGDVVAHVRDGVGLAGAFPPGHPLARVTPRSHAYVKARNVARERAESMRLLYVAMTRAEERLVLTAAATGGRGGARPWWDRVAAVLPRPPESAENAENAENAGEDEAPAPRVVRVAAADPREGGVDVLLHTAPERRASRADGARTLLHGVARTLASGRVPSRVPQPVAIAAAEALLQDARRPLPAARGTLYATTVSALVAFARCPEEFRRRHLLGIPESLDLALAIDGDPGVARAGTDERPGDDDEWGVPLTARAKGRAAHLALERLVPDFDDDVEVVVRACLETETGGTPPSPAEVAELSGWVRGFRDGDVGRVLRTVSRAALRREQAVLLRCGRTVVRGQIDLLFHDGAGWTIVDYKAGALAAAGDAYALQMRLYALALLGVSGDAPRRLLLWSLPSARAVEISASDDELASLRAGLLADFERRTLEHDFEPPRERPCFVCAYRSSCALSLTAREKGSARRGAVP